MINNYEVAEIIEIGRAQDVILGSSKFVPNEDDGIGQPRRETLTEDDE
jgi:hypothetical protein